jgi:hypothetical protein
MKPNLARFGLAVGAGVVAAATWTAFGGPARASFHPKPRLELRIELQTAGAEDDATLVMRLIDAGGGQRGGITVDEQAAGALMLFSSTIGSSVPVKLARVEADGPQHRAVFVIERRDLPAAGTLLAASLMFNGSEVESNVVVVPYFLSTRPARSGATFASFHASFPFTITHVIPAAS